MNKEESKTIPLRKATHKELMEVITDLHTQNYLKEMEIVRLNNIIKEAIDYIDDNTYYKDHKGHINIDDLYIILQKGSDK
jgi:hypothetical protein